MKILRIGGRNLASLAGEFCVDFEAGPLAASGLFAISGPTGAGKSTLLDALCLALYGATPRLIKRSGSQLPDVGSETVSVFDPRTLLRRGCAEGWAEVDFVGTDNARYRARWSVRRARNKASGALQPVKITLLRLPEEVPIGGTNTEVAHEITSRIGLNFEQFTRAVLLAQNEFSAFLKTDENERGELLETLTGTTIYSDLSRRAYERHKHEQARTRELQAQLDSACPLDPEQRAALAQQYEQAKAQLAELEARHALLDALLRWHAEAGQLRQARQQAQDALGQQESAWQQAQQRRLRLATLDAAQPARALMTDIARLRAELQQAQAARHGAHAQLATTQAARTEADAAVDAAQAALQQAEQALADAAPLLDAAKALDASLAALAPGLQAAQAARHATAGEVQAARAQLASHEQALQDAAGKRDSARSWLGEHAHWSLLANDWPHMQRLLDLAQQAQARSAQCQHILDEAQQASARARQQDSEATRVLDDASARHADCASRRDAASAVLATFDGAALAASREQLMQRQQQLADGERHWAQLNTVAASLADTAAQQRTFEQALHDTRAQHDVARQQQAPLAAALAQAEQALGRAELACAASVEKLRATLHQGEPCPVCGAAEHPYAHQDDALHGLLDGLREDVERCRGEASANTARQAALGATIAASEQQLARLAQQHAQLAHEHAQLARTWQASPLAAQLANDAHWFSNEKTVLASELAALYEREQAWRQQSAARETAQRALDAAVATLAASRQQAAATREAVLRTGAALENAQQQLAQASTQQGALLDELDAPLTAVAGEGWRERWCASPAQARAEWERQALAWIAQREQLQAAEAACTQLEGERTHLAERLAELIQRDAAAGQDLARVEAELAGLRARRQQLWDGRAVHDIEQQLARAVEAARTRLAACQQAASAAAQADSACRQSLSMLAERIDELEQLGSRAAQALADWLHDYQARDEMLEPIPNAAALELLLQVSGNWIAQERAALQAIDTALEQARAVAREREARHAAHLAQAPQQADAGLEQVREQHQALGKQRHDMGESVTALRLALLQDDERRARAASAMQDIERQQAIERRWAMLSELIGSADGKRFRNYAQQFTLDVLLGYANEHLRQLARRYRLERVTSSSGPSLALMVRDQDMGGEIRSVNSLSGGESFLVSLALALGLASLSSNRVRVESLFIDEGFGSLDSDTLGVAMDALDTLQSQGRKVGVISHVQEMTERIATRVLVRPSGGGCSEVVVE